MAVVRKSQERNLVAKAKRNAKGWALPKQRRDSILKIDALMNKAPIVRPPLVVLTSGKKKGKAQRAKKASNSLQNYVGKLNVVADLVSAPVGMNFGQPLCGDVDESRKKL